MPFSGESRGSRDIHCLIQIRKLHAQLRSVCIHTCVSGSELNSDSVFCYDFCFVLFGFGGPGGGFGAHGGGFSDNRTRTLMYTHLCMYARPLIVVNMFDFI